MYPALAGLDALSDMIKGGVPVLDESRAKRMLLHASVTVRVAAGQPEGYLDVGLDPDPDFPVAVEVPDALVLVTLEAAKRGYDNPSGYASQQQGDYSYTVAGGATGVYLTRAEQALVAAAVAPPGTAYTGTITYQLDASYRRALRPRERRQW